MSKQKEERSVPKQPERLREHQRPKTNPTPNPNKREKGQGGGTIERL